jgi:hypothetical protein
MSVDVISRSAVLRAGIVVVACLSGALVVLAGPAAASPGSAASTAPAPAAPSPSPQPTSGEPPQSNTAGSVTVTFDSHCANYGFDVTNHDTVAHTGILTVGSIEEEGVPLVVDFRWRS